MPMSVGIR